MSVLSRIRNAARRDYRVMVINNETFENRWDGNLNVGRVWTAGLLVGLGIVLLTTALIAFTPLRELIPGYTDSSLQEKYATAELKLAQLEADYQNQRELLNSLRNIAEFQLADTLAVRQRLMGATEPQTEAGAVPVPEVHAHPEHPEPPQEVIVRSEVDANTPAAAPAESKVVVKTKTVVQEAEPLPRLLVPVKGKLIRGYKPTDGHLGVDLSVNANEPVQAVAAGVVLFADYTLKDGYVVSVLHAGGLVSVYKHNQRLLQRSGAYVGAGEAIALAGNTGENTTGPHVHLEFWWRGRPQNPARLLSL